MEEQCGRLESDNQSLLSKLKEQEEQANQVASHDNGHDNADDDRESQVSGLQGELRTSELEVRPPALSLCEAASLALWSGPVCTTR